MSYTGSSGYDANDYTDPEPTEPTMCQRCEHITIVPSLDPDDTWPTVYCAKFKWGHGEPALDECVAFQPGL